MIHILRPRWSTYPKTLSSQSAVHEKAEEVEAATGYWGGVNDDWPELININT
jgi:hypothetical protein